MKVLFRHKGQLVRVNAEMLVVVRRAPKTNSRFVETYIPGTTSVNTDKKNLIRVLNMVTSAILDESQGSLDVQ